MDTHTEKAISGAALAPLSNEQKRDIILLAKKAYLRQNEQNGQNNSDHSVSFADWRRREQKLCVERGSLTICTNEDFNFLKAHFLSLAGKPEQASAVRIRAAGEPRLWAMNKFEAECRDAADVLPQARQYAAGFLRNARGVSLEQASAKQIWHAIYIIRRRASQLRRKK